MHRHSAALIAIAALAVTCGGDDPSRSERGPRENFVAVAAGPARLVAEAIVGSDHVRAVAAAGTSMATWRPGDEALEAMIGARRIVVVGAEFEPWLQRAGLPPSRTLTLAERGTGDRWIEIGAIEHTHGGGESHSHGGVVPTVWTDPQQLRAFLRACARDLPGAIDGLDAESSKASRRALEGRIDAYEEALEGLRAAAGGRALIATDHGLEYIARAAGIELVVTPLEFGDTGASPNDQAIRDLETLAADSERHAGVLVWPVRLEGQIDRNFAGDSDRDFAAAIHAELGLVSVHFDLGGTLGDAVSDDTLARLMGSIARLHAALLDHKPR